MTDALHTADALLTEPSIWLQHDAEAAIRFYTELIPNSEILSLSSVNGPDGTATVIASFRLGGVTYRALGAPTSFELNESFSITVNCSNQAEVDLYWDALVEGGQEGNCGWLRDRWGLWWQIVPVQLGMLLGDPNPKRAMAATQAMFGQTKIIIAELEAAANAAN